MSVINWTLIKKFWRSALVGLNLTGILRRSPVELEGSRTQMLNFPRSSDFPRRRSRSLPEIEKAARGVTKCTRQRTYPAMSFPTVYISRGYTWEPGSSPLINDIPDLQTLATQGIEAQIFPDVYLTAIITQAQPHHSNRTLAHLTRAQLIDHVNALVSWWKQAHIVRPSSEGSTVDSGSGIASWRESVMLLTVCRITVKLGIMGKKRIMELLSDYLAIVSAHKSY